MIYEHEAPIVGTKHCYVAFGRSSWDKKTHVMKPGWYDVNGHHSRPGAEMWREFFLQSITEAVRVGFVSKKLVRDALADV